MNMFSKSIFTIIVNGLFCLNIAMPVLAQKQTSNQWSNKKKARFTRWRIGRIHAHGQHKQRPDAIISSYITPIHSSSKNKTTQAVLKKRICIYLPSGQTFKKN